MQALEVWGGVNGAGKVGRERNMSKSDVKPIEAFPGKFYTPCQSEKIDMEISNLCWQNGQYSLEKLQCRACILTCGKGTNFLLSRGDI